MESVDAATPTITPTTVAPTRSKRSAGCRSEPRTKMKRDVAGTWREPSGPKPRRRPMTSETATTSAAVNAEAPRAADAKIATDIPATVPNTLDPASFIDDGTEAWTVRHPATAAIAVEYRPSSVETTQESPAAAEVKRRRRIVAARATRYAHTSKSRAGRRRREGVRRESQRRARTERGADISRLHDRYGQVLTKTVPATHPLSSSVRQDTTFPEGQGEDGTPEGAKTLPDTPDGTERTP